jgi:beta-lactam-binding protein with PASTA domain
LTWTERLRRLVPWLVAAVGGFLLAFGVMWVWLGRSHGTPEDVSVPNVIGMRYEQAERLLEAAGFAVRVRDRQSHPTAPEGSVLDQTPPSGVRTPRGTTVALAVSAGQRQVTIPEVVGMTLDAAKAALESGGLDVGDVSEQPSAHPRGEILFSTPAAGASVTLPASVTLVISAGESAVAVPDFFGKPLVAARATLDRLGLTLGVVVVDSASTEAPGTVVQQIPSPGDFVAPGSSVSVTVSKRIP